MDIKKKWLKVFNKRKYIQYKNKKIKDENKYLYENKIIILKFFIQLSVS